MKIEKTYTKEFKDAIIKQLLKGKTLKQLSKEYAVSKQLLNEWLKDFKESQLYNKQACHKVYRAYNANVEKRKGTVYDSKIGGLAYVSEDKEWIKCPSCKTEMVLALQLNIQELPEIPKGLEEWDFVQVFTCMYPHVDIKEVVKCSQIGGYFGKHRDEVDHFNRTFHIELVKKEKEPKMFELPPWFDNYSLQYIDEKVVSTRHDDKHSYEWVESHCSKEKVISSWHEIEVKCDDQRNFHDKEGLFYDEDWEKKPCSPCTSSKHAPCDLFGIISSVELTNRAGFGENPNCLECDECMTLLYQFSMFHDPFSDAPSFQGEFDIATSEEGHSYVNTFALYYCPKHPALMSCRWVCISK